MSETLSSEDLVIGQQIRVLADAGVVVRDPNALSRAVVHRSQRRGVMGMPLGLIASASALLLVAVFAVTSFSQMGSSPTTAQIGGITVAGITVGATTYGVGAAPNINLSTARMTVFGEARQNTGFRTEGSTAYQVDDLNPQQVLVMKLIPGQHDDVGSTGDYLVLTRGDGYSQLCPYFQAGDPLAPSVCD